MSLQARNPAVPQRRRRDLPAAAVLVDVPAARGELVGRCQEANGTASPRIVIGGAPGGPRAAGRAHLSLQRAVQSAVLGLSVSAGCWRSAPCGTARRAPSPPSCSPASTAASWSCRRSTRPAQSEARARLAGEPETIRLSAFRRPPRLGSHQRRRARDPHPHLARQGGDRTTGAPAHQRRVAVGRRDGVPDRQPLRPRGNDTRRVQIAAGRTAIVEQIAFAPPRRRSLAHIACRAQVSAGAPRRRRAAQAVAPLGVAMPSRHRAWRPIPVITTGQTVH